MSKNIVSDESSAIAKRDGIGGALTPYLACKDGVQVQAILDAVPASIVFVDAGGRVVGGNLAWRRLFDDRPGFAPGAIGSDYALLLGEIIVREPDAASELVACLREILEGRQDAGSFVYPTESLGQQRWSRVDFSAFKAGQQRLVVAMHLDVSESVAEERRLFQLAHFDALSGLPNRLLFIDRLKQTIARAERDRSQLAVVCADIDRLKTLNDTFGHPVGDALVREFGKRLSATLRQSDTVGRLGGGEFALMLPDLHHPEQAGPVVRKLLHGLKQPFQLFGQDAYASACFGIAVYPDDATDAEILLRRAEEAMYRAKEQGSNEFQYFVPAMNDRSQERWKLANDLRSALDRGEFFLLYQPKVSCTSGAIVGAEALIRWQHPVRGMVSPGEFIPLLEELHLIEDVGAWVIDEVCRQLSQWRAEGVDAPSIAVNLSARQMDNNQLVSHVSAAVTKHGVRPDQLELELTETVLMRDVERIIPTLAELRRMGIRLSVDDFGTGYSSLSYLKQFPLDAVKVDRSFIQDITADPDDASITRAIITMAHQLKLKVVAEGVETEGQLALLVANQCDEIQGFYFSRPAQADDLGTMIREKRGLPPAVTRPTDRERTLLLVDDEENILTSLRRLLRRDGYRILAATSAAEGLEILAKNAVDVIVSDQRMPVMTGVEFLRRVKTIHPESVRMVLSGYTELQSITDAINEGAIYKFLTKPWDDEQLCANIREAFRHKELADENRRLGRELLVANTQLARANRQLQDLLASKEQRIVRDEAMVGVIQRVLQQVQIPIAGIDNEGMIVFANEEANRVLGSGVPLLGAFAAECLPAPLVPMTRQTDPDAPTWRSSAKTYRVFCQPMDDSRPGDGSLLLLIPDGEVYA